MGQRNTREQWLLRLSMLLALACAIVTIGFGLLVGSSSILFDGVYTVVEAAMTGLSLITARLIARGDDQIFQYGYWHLEPLVALINSLILALACIYGFLDGVNGLLSGGRLMDFGHAILFYLVASTLYVSLYLYLRRSGRKLGSQLLDIDARSWLIGAILGGALTVGFLLGDTLSGTRAGWLAPYVDPAILTIVSLCLLPLPVRTIINVAREILQIAPEDLDGHVHEVAQAIAARNGFRRFDTHVRRTGRQRFVEVSFAATPGDDAISYLEMDRIRGEIAGALGGTNPGCWLTVDFTAEDRWI